MPRRKREPRLDWRNGVAYIFWYDEAKRRTERLSLRTTDQVEARARFAAFLTDGHDILAGKPRGPEGITLWQALDDYLREHVTEKVVDKTRIEAIACQLKGFFAPDTLLKDIDIPQSRRYREERRVRSLAEGARRRPGCDATIRRELSTITAAANHAMRWKRIERNSLPVIELPNVFTLEPLSDDKWLTKEELQATIEAAEGDLKHFILITYDSASRRRAVERLTRFQIDLKRGTVNLRGPDEDENQRRSRKRRPVVPIGPLARPSYEALLAKTNSQWLFGEPRDWYYAFRCHMEGLGLGRKANPHILRHSRATHLLQDGVDIFAVAKLLGDTVATVEKVYGHHSPDYLAGALQRRSG